MLYTFGIPSYDYLKDKRVQFLTNVKCSGNGKRAKLFKVVFRIKYNFYIVEQLTLQIPQATVHSSEVALA